MNIQESETISFDLPIRRASAMRFRSWPTTSGPYKDVGLLSIVIGILVNAGDAGYLAQPNATREILTAVSD